MSLRQEFKRGLIVRSLAAMRERMLVNKAYHTPKAREALRLAFAAKSAELVELELRTYQRRVVRAAGLEPAHL